MSSTPIPTAKYDRKDGLYRFAAGDTVLHESDKIAIAYSALPNGTILYRHHGTPDAVNEWLARTQNQYRKHNLNAFADELKVVVKDDWEVEDLNQILRIEGFLQTFLESRGDAGFTAAPTPATGTR